MPWEWGSLQGASASRVEEKKEREREGEGFSRRARPIRAGVIDGTRSVLNPDGLISAFTWSRLATRESDSRLCGLCRARRRLPPACISVMVMGWDKAEDGIQDASFGLSLVGT